MEQKLHPEYDGMPLAVCGDPKARHGIVLAKNQLAKQAGVKTAETIWEAKQKCPELVLVEPHFDEYVKYSKQVFEIYTSFTDRVESFGIDECWLDVTGCERLFGDGKAIADTLRKTVKEKTGLTISVGVSFTKTLAKLGSDLKKPDATTVLDEKHYMQIIGNMPPSEMIMVGKHTSEKLEKLNIRTIKDLANADRNALRYQFGIIADTLVNAAQGIETEEVKNTMTCASPRACQKARPLRETSRARTRQKSSYTPLPNGGFATSRLRTCGKRRVPCNQKSRAQLDVKASAAVTCERKLGRYCQSNVRSSLQNTQFQRAATSNHGGRNQVVGKDRSATQPF